MKLYVLNTCVKFEDLEIEVLTDSGETSSFKCPVPEGVYGFSPIFKTKKAMEKQLGRKPSPSEYSGVEITGKYE